MDQQLFTSLKKKIGNKTAKVAIIGLGYVGEHLGKYISKANYEIIGFDKDLIKIKQIQQKKIFSEISNNFEKLQNADIIIIALPTPIYKNKKPNLSIIKNVARLIQKNLQKGQLIILESSVSPGTTRNILFPILKKNKNEFFLGYSPERVDFGNSKYNIKNTPKIVAGLNKQSYILTKEFYSQIVNTIVPVTSLEIAEFSKMLENVVRFVNINLINELEEYSIKKDIDIWQVIDAAATKPFGFFPYYPSAGISGHCIPVDPYYILQDAKKKGLKPQILKQAMSFHEKRIIHIANQAIEILKKKNTKKPYKILIIGIAIKPQSLDARESVGLKIIKLLQKKGVLVSYHDPYIAKIDKYRSKKLTSNILKKQDLIIIITEHKNINYDLILESKKIIIDLKNVYRKKHKNIIKL